MQIWRLAVRHSTTLAWQSGTGT